MGNLKTKNLQLIKPVAGHNNWGDAVNQNWEAIDRQYGVLDANIKSFEERLGEMGIFNFWYSGHAAPDNLYAKDGVTNGVFTQDVIFANVTSDQEGVSKIQLGYLQDDSTTDNPISIQPQEDESNLSATFTSVYELTSSTEDTEVANISMIPTYTAFYVLQDCVVYDDTTDNGMNLYGGDVMVFTQVVEDNQTKIKIKRMTQAIGSTYSLRQVNDSNSNQITGQKVINPYARNHIQFYIPTTLVRSTKSSFGIGESESDIDYDTQVTLHTQLQSSATESAKYKQHIADVRFYDESGKSCILEYAIVLAGIAGSQTYHIKVHNPYSFKGTCSYMVGAEKDEMPNE